MWSYIMHRRYAKHAMTDLSILIQENNSTLLERYIIYKK